MKRNSLVKDSKSETVQVFPLIQGKVNITTGIHPKVTLVRCVVDGTLVIHWNDPADSSDSIECVTGDDYAICPDAYVEITLGTFHLA